jgi:serine/threonine-protein kinase
MSTLGYGGWRIDPRGDTGRIPQSQLLRHLANSSHTIRWNHGQTLPELVPERDAARADHADLFQPGQIVGGCYEIRTLLGAGGMGQVYEANDRALNRLVAIKVAWPDVGPDPLRREAQVLAAFRHPGLVSVHALVSNGGFDFMVLERLSGVTLAESLMRTPTGMPVGECLDLLIAMAQALQPLHVSGLAHADLKPANIMLVPGGRLVLLDFGIARIEQMRSGSQRISGSPHYMAPETVRGTVQVGAAHLIDLYALGVIAFAALAGKPPYDHENPVELMMQHVHVPTPHVASLRAEVPPALDRLIVDLMAKDPSDRPADVEVLLVELKRLAGRR